MASKDYLKLQYAANKDKIKLARKQEAEIRNIYKSLYSSSKKKLETLGLDPLDRLYLDVVKKVYKEEIKKANSKIMESIKRNTEKSSTLAVNSQVDFFKKVAKEEGINIDNRLKDMFSKIPTSAMNEILSGKAYKDRSGLSERIWQDTKLFNKDIDYIIAEGIAGKKSAYEVAKDLEKYVKNEAKKDFEWSKVYPRSRKVVDYNAQRLARTSISHAFTMAQKRSCEKNPFVEKIEWLTSNSHRTCSECLEKEGKTYLINDLPFDHANGMCTTVPVLEKSLEEIGAELREWMNE